MTLAIQQIIKSQVESTEQFPVDFEEYSNWLGFSTKGNAKRAFDNCGFEDNFDFCSFIRNDKREIGATRTNILKLTVNCAKEFAMMAKTEKGKEVRKWYLQLEKEYRTIKEQQLQAKQSKMSLSKIEWSWNQLVKSGQISQNDAVTGMFKDASEHFPEMREMLGRLNAIRESKGYLTSNQDELLNAMYERMLTVCIKHADRKQQSFVLARDLAGDAITTRKDFMTRYCPKKAKQMNKPEIHQCWQEMHDLGLGVFNKTEGTFTPNR
jgi:phage anti-repressor protein